MLVDFKQNCICTFVIHYKPYQKRARYNNTKDRRETKRNGVGVMDTDVGSRKKTDYILSALPDSVINFLDEVMLSEIRRIETEIAPSISSSC